MRSTFWKAETLELGVFVFIGWSSGAGKTILLWGLWCIFQCKLRYWVCVGTLN